jgi:hypothetical protein
MDLSVRPKGTKFLEKNTRKRLCDTGFGNGVLGYDSKAQAIKEQNKHVELHHTKMFPHNKGINQQN